MAIPLNVLHHNHNPLVNKHLYKIQGNRNNHTGAKWIKHRLEGSWEPATPNYAIYEKCKFWLQDFEEAEIFYFAYTPITNIHAFYRFLTTPDDCIDCKYYEELSNDQKTMLYEINLDSLAKQAAFRNTGNAEFPIYTEDAIAWALQQKEIPKKRLSRLIEVKECVFAPIFSDNTPVNSNNILPVTQGLEHVEFILWNDFLNIFALNSEAENRLIQAVNDKVIYGEPKSFLNYKTGIQWLLAENLFPEEYQRLFRDTIQSFLVDQIIDSPPAIFTLKELTEKLGKRERDILQDAYNEHFGTYLKIKESDAHPGTVEPPENVSNPTYIRRFIGFERIFANISKTPGYPYSESQLSVKNFMDNPGGRIKVISSDCLNTYHCHLQVTATENKYGKTKYFSPKENTEFTKDDLVFFEDEINSYYFSESNSKPSLKDLILKDVNIKKKDKPNNIRKIILNFLGLIKENIDSELDFFNIPMRASEFHTILYEILSYPIPENFQAFKGYYQHNKSGKVKHAQICAFSGKVNSEFLKKVKAFCGHCK